ncbi:uncharacterized protein TRUGW13939_11829 [Talaromyces rugulosus]|uniref:Fungal lipase-type domain-containing protein n=1 Tax=Talaromyces rugulosus TaxID=121627 RepID=A0A7H8RJ36_TALRU|nr:uncharacterized protein TRUGW13939_11829 [Talaromyces rugulosus]QKX64653.1 hypothetical protein TRUGW13939_11829 [Talaromyces rugulosus]
MDHDSPPPPYQTLPPTPVLSPAAHHQSPAAHAASSAYSLAHPPQGPTVFYYPQNPAAATAGYPYPTAHHPNNTYHVRPTKPQRCWQSRMNLGSLAATLNDAGNLAVETYSAVLSPRPSRQQYTGALDAVGMRLDEVITSIDNETFKGEINEIVVDAHYTDAAPPLPPRPGKKDSRHESERKHQISPQNQVKARISTTKISPFTKVRHYANACTSSSLPPLKLQFETWPLLCLAATYSRRAYEKPSGPERHTYISGDWLRGTKDMLVKSVPLDDMNTIVFAIRGTQNFRDWAVNMNTEPAPPSKFLYDEGNLCHSGFLSVARNMVKPVAARLRDLLNENPQRASCTLVITGHSAGGAVAALLYCHMFSQTVSSELTHLRGLFKRVHCVTFGAPPVSLLPLQRQDCGSGRKPYDSKSLFFGFVNEGDPVARADKTYVKSLLELYAKPSRCSTSTSQSRQKATWKVPEATLSLAGRLVVLRAHRSRSSRNSKKPDTVEAVTAADVDLRGLVFGDPLMHTMDLYAQRIELLATQAVVGRLKVT